MEVPRPERGSQPRGRVTPVVAESTPPTVVEIWSPACVECRAMQSDLDAVATQYSDRVGLELVNAFDELETVQRLGVRGTPTLIGVRANEEVFRLVGRRTRSELEALFEAIAEGEKAPAVGQEEMLLRLGAGVSLVAAGSLSGPAWALVAIGVAILTFGVISWPRK